MRRRPTIADVATQAGVDRAVVSKVLNNAADLRVREETRARVLRAVEELGYRPRSAARSLRTSRTGAIGFVIPTFNNPIWAVILDAAEEEADRQGYTLLAGTARTGSARTSRFLDLTRAGAVDALLVAAALTDDDLAQSYGDIPWLYINRRTATSRRHVLLDDAGGARLATEHLIELGHRRIAHLSGPMDTDSGQRRWEGCLAALTDSGLEPAGFAEAGYTFSTGTAAMHELLSSTTPPTAVMVANVASAAGALRAAREAGANIPGEISIIALHDIELADALGPPLTTVQMPLAELGRRAIQLLLQSPQDEPIEEVIPGPMRIIDRSSTSRPG